LGGHTLPKMAAALDAHDDDVVAAVVGDAVPAVTKSGREVEGDPAVVSASGKSN
jgi:hypothetical protein